MTNAPKGFERFKDLLWALSCFAPQKNFVWIITHYSVFPLYCLYCVMFILYKLCVFKSPIQIVIIFIIIIIL